MRLERTVSWSQTRRDTNFAIPGYSLFCHDTTASGKNKVFSVCGHLCGQRRFCAAFCNRGKSRKCRRRKALRRFTLPRPGYRHGTPKAGALPTALHPDFLFCFFLKIFRASMLCPPAIRLAQADHGTCVILIYPAGFVKRVIGRATVAAPFALMHTQRKIPPLWLTPGRWYSLGAKISPGTAGWTGSGHRYPAARLRWSCLRSPGAWPAARPPKRLHRS